MKSGDIIFGAIVIALFFGGSGYMFGNSNGIDEGYDWGYDIGHLIGQEDGYDEGYEMGISMSIGDINETDLSKCFIGGCRYWKENEADGTLSGAWEDASSYIYYSVTKNDNEISTITTCRTPDMNDVNVATGEGVEE